MCYRGIIHALRSTSGRATLPCMWRPAVTTRRLFLALDSRLWTLDSLVLASTHTLWGACLTKTFCPCHSQSHPFTPISPGGFSPCTWRHAGALSGTSCVSFQGVCGGVEMKRNLPLTAQVASALQQQVAQNGTVASRTSTRQAMGRILQLATVHPRHPAWELAGLRPSLPFFRAIALHLAPPR